jgi:hypothetical protein
MRVLENNFGWKPIESEPSRRKKARERVPPGPELDYGRAHSATGRASPASNGMGRNLVRARPVDEAARFSRAEARPALSLAG